MTIQPLAMIGFGEAAQALAGQLAVPVGAFDRKTCVGAPRHAKLDDYCRAGIGGVLTNEAASAARTLARLGFSSVAIAGPAIGDAGTIKRMWSVMVKGIEAVIASLDASWPGMGRADRGDDDLQRMIVHGGRGAEESEKAGRTLPALGIDPATTRAAAEAQQRAGLSLDATSQTREAMLPVVGDTARKDAA